MLADACEDKPFSFAFKEDKKFFIEIANKCQPIYIKEFLEEKVDSIEITGFHWNLPSIEFIRFLLDKSLDPSKLLNAALQAKCKQEPWVTAPGIEGIIFYEPDEEMEKTQLNLVKLLLKNNANPNKIEKFSETPSINLANLLLENGLNPNKLLALTLSIKQRLISFHHNSISRLIDIIALAIEKGASLDKNQFPEAKETIQKGSLVNLHQSYMEHKLYNIFDKLKTAEEKEYFADLRSHMLTTGGAGYLCVGLTTFWLYSKWLQFAHPEKTYGYHNHWFKKTKKTIAKYDIKKELSDSELYSFISFANLLHFFQNQHNNLPQLDIEKKITQSMLDTDGKTLKKKFSITSTFNVETLQKTLEETVHDGELVFISYPSHMTGLFKSGENYYFYDPENNHGEYRCTSTKEIATLINNYNHHCQLILGLMVFSFDGNNNSYPNEKEILAQAEAVDPSMAYQTARLVIECGSLESFKFFFNQKTLEKHNIPFLINDILLNNKTDILKEFLLNEKSDPNFICIYWNYTKKIHEHLTPLSFAAKQGCIEAAKILLKDPRTDVNLTHDQDNKTAIMHAEENGCTEIADLLRQEMTNKK